MRCTVDSLRYLEQDFVAGLRDESNCNITWDAAKRSTMIHSTLRSKRIVIGEGGSRETVLRKVLSLSIDRMLMLGQVHLLDLLGKIVASLGHGSRSVVFLGIAVNHDLHQEDNGSAGGRCSLIFDLP